MRRSRSTPEDVNQSWGLFTNLPRSEREKAGAVRRRDETWPQPPPWREFLKPSTDEQSQELAAREISYWQQCDQWRKSNADLDTQDRDRRRGEVFRLPRASDGGFRPEAEKVRLAVNAAIHLRRPLLVTGPPGCGKTSLAYAIAEELDLGPVLSWPVTPRSQLQEGGLYLYDAVGRLQEAGWTGVSAHRHNGDPGQDADATDGSPTGRSRPTSDYLTLGPVGTAFLPFSRPRVLLIDELDKGDLQLPNELLNLFEEGFFEIPQLVREARRQERPEEISTADPGGRWLVMGGRVVCREFPIVILTSNGERDFPAAFHRRCIRVTMPVPTHEDLVHVVGAHFNLDAATPSDQVDQEVRAFLGDDSDLDRATDQLLNALHLLTMPDGAPASDQERNALRDILYRRLHD